MRASAIGASATLCGLHRTGADASSAVGRDASQDPSSGSADPAGAGLGAAALLARCASDERASPVTGLMALRHRQGSGEFGIRVAGHEPVRCLAVNEGVIGQPLDGAARGTGIAEGIPGWQQARELLVEFVFEAAEGCLARMAGASLRPARPSVIPSAKSAMSWYQTQDGSGSMQTRSSSDRTAQVKHRARIGPSSCSRARAKSAGSATTRGPASLPSMSRCDRCRRERRRRP
jgi:hypothetical protein